MGTAPWKIKLKNILQKLPKAKRELKMSKRRPKMNQSGINEKKQQKVSDPFCRNVILFQKGLNLLNNKVELLARDKKP